MDYRIEVFDPSGRRVACYDEVPLLEATRTTPDQPDRVIGMLPSMPAEFGHDFRVRVTVGGQHFGDTFVTRINPQWSDTRKLILERYVNVHEVFAFEAERPALDGNTAVARTYTDRRIAAIVKDLVNSAPGPLHYLVRHGTYPEGAQREYAKFLARKTADNELEVGGIGAGQWVGASRVDASAAYAEDGRTVAGLIVDGEPWPDLRLMLVEAEETSLNADALSRHPETAAWTAARYDASGYKLRADAARNALQALIETHGIDCIELDPHRDASGAFDGRVDPYGRYVGLVYGGGECFNAALVEQGLAEIALAADQQLDPDMGLKDFYSYTQVCDESVEDTGVTLSSFDFSGGVYEALTALAYAESGAVWSVDADLAVRFRGAVRPDRVLVFQAEKTGVAFGSDSSGVISSITFERNPFAGAASKTYARAASIEAYGLRVREFACFAVSREVDGDKLIEGLLDDIAYPAPDGTVTFFRGDASLRVGDLIELRGHPLRRVDAGAAGEWGGRFAGWLVGRVNRVTHRFSGREVSTFATLTSPLRSVGDPLHFMVRSQPTATQLYQFRLDDSALGVDQGYHLD